MAKYGRGGDQFVAHLAPGEIIVPAPLIENNPELRDSIFGHLREMGIENPEQYVVGASANSINPETGLMEFGFLSKVFKGVKRVVKGSAGFSRRPLRLFCRSLVRRFLVRFGARRLVRVLPP